MANNSKIAWTDATWNPVTGCTKVSPACTNCYAEKMALRLQRMGSPRYTDGFAVRTHYEALTEPLHWKNPRRVFVVSMGDLFHPDVPNDFIDAIFGIMAASPRHTFQVLTKRPERMYDYFRFRPRFWDWVLTHPADCGEYGNNERLPDVLPNVWLGVTAENQEQADARIPLLLQTPAAVRFVSVEPMLGAVDLRGYLPGIEWFAHEEPMDSPLDWVIAGCESGPGARPTNEDWARSLRDQCVTAGVPFFYKQAMRAGKLVKMPDLGERRWAELPGVRA